MIRPVLPLGHRSPLATDSTRQISQRDTLQTRVMPLNDTFREAPSVPSSSEERLLRQGDLGWRMQRLHSTILCAPHTSTSYPHYFSMIVRVHNLIRTFFSGPLSQSGLDLLANVLRKRNPTGKSWGNRV